MGRLYFLTTNYVVPFTGWPKWYASVLYAVKQLNMFIQILYRIVNMDTADCFITSLNLTEMHKVLMVRENINYLYMP